MSSYLIAGNRIFRALNSVASFYMSNGKDITGSADNSGKTVNQYVYSAYGRNIDLNGLPINHQPSTINQTFSLDENPFKYSSYYQDTESGMYYLVARYYSPSLMRFISMDTYDLPNKYAIGMPGCMRQWSINK